MLHFSATGFITEHTKGKGRKNKPHPGLLIPLLPLIDVWVSTLLTHLLLNVESQGNSRDKDASQFDTVA